MSEMNRRQFVLAAGAAGAAACACALCSPDVLAAPPSSVKIDVGTPADYPADVVSEKFVKANKLLVVRSGDRIYAMNPICTHKGCIVKLKGSELKCPCHGSAFSAHGTVTAGPAKASLFRYQIEKTDKGRLVVDKSKQFGERQWDEAGSFVKVS